MIPFVAATGKTDVTRRDRRHAQPSAYTGKIAVEEPGPGVSDRCQTSRFVGRHRPGDAESGIAPQEAAIVLGRVVSINFINYLGIRVEREYP